MDNPFRCSGKDDPFRRITPKVAVHPSSVLIFLQFSGRISLIGFLHMMSMVFFCSIATNSFISINISFKEGINTTMKRNWKGLELALGLREQG